MFKVTMMAVMTTENGSLLDAGSEILTPLMQMTQMTHESLSTRENSQNKLVVISKMIFLPGHHGVGGEVSKQNKNLGNFLNQNIYFWQAGLKKLPRTTRRDRGGKPR